MVITEILEKGNNNYNMIKLRLLIELKLLLLQKSIHFLKRVGEFQLLGISMSRFLCWYHNQITTMRQSIVSK